ncbi:hypothetical protein HanXRQr2_Chr04g0185771 [Helianthus annuus]|uniref:Uncharacterized protein n=1 Tax=Helianthus annuus TaxID=4232 RepID=A0A9K3JAR1_HELAN|nr:hypothetical protein HanXRQr2_Chr04g0185771 [Helianthus annuus]KAJ0590673.1 hypothetical protein HanIR_Chr04g0200101 [Helianthus annuus]KAJ0932935.1 hypothetical protein HanPSC8_Chr04g0179351 [Helianthus annuus]
MYKIKEKSYVLYIYHYTIYGFENSWYPQNQYIVMIRYTKINSIRQYMKPCKICIVEKYIDPYTVWRTWIVMNGKLSESKSGVNEFLMLKIPDEDRWMFLAKSNRADNVIKTKEERDKLKSILHNI